MSLFDITVVATRPQLLDDGAYDAVVSAALQVAVRAWRRIRRLSLLTDEYRRDEPRTAGLLRNEMVRIERARSPRVPPFKIKAEVGTLSQENVEVPDGSIDIEIIVSLRDDPDIRLECKRVSASVHDDRARLCSLYVSEGVVRFVRDHYGRGQRLGVMVGFVIDGNCADATRLINGYLDASGEYIVAKPWSKELRFGRHRHLFSSRHGSHTSTREIDILHLLLPFPKRDRKAS